MPHNRTMQLTLFLRQVPLVVTNLTRLLAHLATVAFAHGLTPITHVIMQLAPRIAHIARLTTHRMPPDLRAGREDGKSKSHRCGHHRNHHVCPTHSDILLTVSVGGTSRLWPVVTNAFTQ